MDEAVSRTFTAAAEMATPTIWDNAIVIDRTVEDLTNALETCINNNKLREKVSNNARQTILERYTPEIVGKQYAELYRKITH